MSLEIKIPAEWEPHAFCFMAWAVHREWGADVDNVKRELREVISTVAEYEPVRLLVPPDLIDEAQNQNFCSNVEIVPAPVDDIWMRDILPTFALRDRAPIAIDWNFNSWGSTRRPRPGDRLAGLTRSVWEVASIHAPFIAEGGAFLTDGEGTIITTKSCLLNPNRNPGFGRSIAERMREIEVGLFGLGARTVIWLEGDADEPITSGHADGYVLFANPGKLIVEEMEPDFASEQTRAADVSTLRNAIDAADRPIDVTAILPPRRRYLRFSGGSFAPCYLNAYVADGAVITGKFGDPERDAAACKVLEQSFPGREIQMLSIDHIVAGGGGVHCLTQPVPAKQVRVSL